MAIDRKGVQGIRTMAALHDQRRTRTTAGALIELSALANEKMLLEREVARATRRGKEIQHRLREIDAKEVRLMQIVRGAWRRRSRSPRRRARGSSPGRGRHTGKQTQGQRVLLLSTKESTMSVLASSQPTNAVARGRYLYAIAEGVADGQTFDFPGLDGSDVHAIGDGTISAIVSDLPNQRLRAERRRLAAHHDVLRRLMADRTVLPIAFGVVADGPDAVKRILRMNRRAFSEQMDRIRGRVEMGLRVVWDVPNIFEYMIGRHEELRSLRDRIFRGGREPTQDDKIDLGRAFDRLLNEDRESHLQRVCESLEGHVEEIKANPPRTEREVMNLACLVDRQGLASFEQNVFEVARRFDNNFGFDINGPWPAHNFVEISLQLS
ncbi:MAG: GvpL/GvpF family gas vesicle protein [Isosphaeraceae bacterium]